MKMKDSGIEWLGQIPEHWDVTLVKNYCKSIFAGATPSTKNESYWDGNIPWLASGCCQDGDVIEASDFITKEGYENASTKMIHADTTLMAMTGATCSKLGYLTFDACANQSVAAYVGYPYKLHAKYLFYLLLSARKYVLTFQTGGAQAGVNIQDCSNLVVPVLPLTEQQSIAEYLDKKCTKIDAIVSNIEQQIEQYKLLKRSLINEVVTGRRAI